MWYNESMTSEMNKAITRYAEALQNAGEVARAELRRLVLEKYPTAVGYTIEADWDHGDQSVFLGTVLVSDATDLVDEPELGEMAVHGGNASDELAWEEFSGGAADECVGWIFLSIGEPESLEVLTVRFE